MSTQDKSYWEGFNAALDSLKLGVEVSRDGAAVCLMSAVGDRVLVLKSALVLNNKPVVL